MESRWKKSRVAKRQALQEELTNYESAIKTLKMCIKDMEKNESAVKCRLSCFNDTVEMLKHSLDHFEDHRRDILVEMPRGSTGIKQRKRSSEGLMDISGESSDTPTIETSPKPRSKKNYIKVPSSKSTGSSSKDSKLALKRSQP